MSLAFTSLPSLGSGPSCYNSAIEVGAISDSRENRGLIWFSALFLGALIPLRFPSSSWVVRCLSYLRSPFCSTVGTLGGSSHSSTPASTSGAASSVYSDIVICSSGASDAASYALERPILLASALNQALTFLNSTSGHPKYSANLLVVVRRRVRPSLLLSMRPMDERSLT